MDNMNCDKRKLKTYYDELYSKGGFGYVRQAEREILIASSVLSGLTLSPKLSLMDIACGDGFWSGILSEWFIVSGVDISETGIKTASKQFPQCTFTVADVLTTKPKQKFDVAFCRSPSFLNFDTYSKEFTDGLEACLAYCSMALIYIKWTAPPYDYYEGQSYCHNPRKVEEVFKRYGKTKIIERNNYMFAVLYLEG